MAATVFSDIRFYRLESIAHDFQERVTEFFANLVISILPDLIISRNEICVQNKKDVFHIFLNFQISLPGDSKLFERSEKMTTLN